MKRQHRSCLLHHRQLVTRRRELVVHLLDGWRRRHLRRLRCLRRPRLLLLLLSLPSPLLLLLLLLPLQLLLRHGLGNGAVLPVVPASQSAESAPLLRMLSAIGAVRHSRLLARAQVVRQAVLQVARRGIAPALQQQPDQSLGVVDGGHMQRRLAVFVPGA